MRIFVTGGSGFVGGHVIEHLSQTHEVLAMARSKRSAKTVEGYGARAVMCSLGSVSAKDLEGVDAIVHAAAFVEEWGTRAKFFEVNVVGTQQLLAAAKEACVSRFIHIGTEAAIFDGSDLIDADEEWPYPKTQRFLYSESKAEAERCVLASSNDSFVALSIRPRFVWGPRDTSVLPAVLRMAKEGSWMWMNHGEQKTSTTHVYNLVHAVSLALSVGQGGCAYFVADEERTTLRDFLSTLAKTQNVDLPGRSMPAFFVRGLAVVVEGIWRLLRIKKTPPMTRFAIFMMSASVTVSTKRATQELGYAPIIKVEDGMRELAV